MDKLFVEDIPAALESVVLGIRSGLRKIRNDNVAIVQAPDKIDFDFTVIITKDSLVRTDTSARDPTTTTNVTGASIDTDTRVTGASRVTDETENMNWTRNGTEAGGETGVETGGSSGGQSVAHSDSGGEIETYTYENV